MIKTPIYIYDKASSHFNGKTIYRVAVKSNDCEAKQQIKQNKYITVFLKFDTSEEVLLGDYLETKYIRNLGMCDIYEIKDRKYDNELAVFEEFYKNPLAGY